MEDVRGKTVLVVDDNQDMVRFYQRATDGTSYHIVPVNEGRGIYYIRSGSGVGTGQAGRPVAGSGLLDDPRAGCGSPPGGLIAGPVVNHDDLANRLSRHGPDHITKCVFFS